MPDYKNGKWAKKIVELQKDDGSWGYFHGLAMPTSQQPITTEQALKRLRVLGYTKDDLVITKSLSYMHDCLAGTKVTPDRREKGLIGIYLQTLCLLLGLGDLLMTTFLPTI